MTVSILDRLRPRSWALTLATLAIVAGPARGQGPDGGPIGRLEEMRAIVRTIQVSDPARPTSQPASLIAEPLHRWNDPTRDFSDATLWAFGKVGRPVALATLELYGGEAKATPAWSSELISVAPGPILGAAEGDFYTPVDKGVSEPHFPLRWAPKGLGVEMKAIAEAPTPGPSGAVRLRQMKALAARVSAHEDVHGPADARPRYELRLMPRPVHRYADPATGLIDGAIFLLAYGTNPELLVLVEAREPGKGAAAWTCGFARLTTAAISASLDGREVWTRPAADEPDVEGPYYFVRTARRTKD